MTADPILVTGATGPQGNAVLRALRADSAEVRARFPELSLRRFRGWVEAQLRR